MHCPNKKEETPQTINRVEIKLRMLEINLPIIPLVLIVIIHIDTLASTLPTMSPRRFLIGIGERSVNSFFDNMHKLPQDFNRDDGPGAVVVAVFDL